MKYYLSILLLSSFLFLVVANNVFAVSTQKEKGSISGKIIEKHSREALEFVTVSMLDTAQKATVVGTTNANGEFILKNIPFGQYTLKLSFIGYADVVLEIELSEEKELEELGEIEMEADAQMLDETVITARRPVIERQIDKLVMTVANTVMAENSTAFEVLRKAPGIAIDKDGNITLNGQAVAVWVDNRPTQLSGQELTALLEGTEGSSIDKIEIIDQPSSKYDAAGSGGIVNIITKKNFLKGFNGTVRTGYTHYFENDFYYSANGSLNLNYRNDLINTYINIGLSNSKGFSLSDANLSAPTSSYSRTTHSFIPDNGNNQYVKAGIDFFIDKKNVIGIIGSFTNSNWNTTSTGFIEEHNAIIVTVIDNSGSSTNRYLNGSGNLNYTHYFDDKGHEITLNADYLHYESIPKRALNTTYHSLVSTTTYTSESKQYTTVWSGKADYILPIGEKIKLEAGGKTSFNTIDSDIRHDGFISAEAFSGRNDNFTYNENIKALYATAGWKIDNYWIIKGGLRWEHTYSKGVWRGRDTTTTKSYYDFFPTIFAGYNPTEKHNLRLSYTMRIGRPSFWNLNPFRNYSNAYSYYEGNPDLYPTYSHRFSLSYMGFQVFNAGVSYSFYNNNITSIPQFDPITHISGYRQENFGRCSGMGVWLGLSALPITKWWDLTVNLYGSYRMSEDGSYKSTSLSGYMYSNNTFTIGKTWNIEMDFWINSGGKWEYYHFKPQGSFDIGVKKTFWGKKGTLSLYLDDVLSTSKSNSYSDKDGVRQESESRWESRSLRVSFSYRFGNTGKPVRQRNVGDQEEAGRLGGGGKN
ncbi:MAG: TonB-dependent receptor [Bacteroidales bacterium]|nr:TonB-dependent receptor [Bacteroidales bacterium]